MAQKHSWQDFLRICPYNLVGADCKFPASITLQGSHAPAEPARFALHLASVATICLFRTSVFCWPPVLFVYHYNSRSTMKFFDSLKVERVLTLALIPIMVKSCTRMMVSASKSFKLVSAIRENMWSMVFRGKLWLRLTIASNMTRFSDSCRPFLKQEHKIREEL